jgi:hypothetical protein
MAKEHSRFIIESLVKPMNLMRFWKERSWSSEARFARLNQLQKSEEATIQGEGGLLGDELHLKRVERQKIIRGNLTSYVREIFGVQQDPDEFGDYFFTVNSGLYKIHFAEPADPIIKIHLTILKDIELEAELLNYLNLINSQTEFTRVFHTSNNSLLMKGEIWGVDLNIYNLTHMVRQMSMISDQYGHVLLEKFGGNPLFVTKLKAPLRAVSEEVE